MAIAPSGLVKVGFSPVAAPTLPICLIIGGLALVTATLSVSSAETVVVAAIASLIISILGGAAGAAQAKSDVLSPLVLLAVFFGVNFGVRTLWLVAVDDPLLPTAIAVSSYEERLIPGLVAAIVGFSSLAGGYFTGLQSRCHPVTSRLRWPASAPSARIYALWLFGVAAIGSRIWRGELVGRDLAQDRIDSLTFVTLSGSLFALHAISITSCYLFRRKAPRHLAVALWVLFLPAAGLQTLVFGAKAPLLLALFSVAAAWHYTRTYLTFNLRTVCIGFLAVGLFPFVNLYRADVYGQFGDRAWSATEFAANIGTSAATARDLGVSTYLRLAVEGILARSTGVDTVALIVEAIPKHEPYALGADYIRAPLYALVPRIVWPEKPTLNAGAEFGREFLLDPTVAQRSYTSFGMTHIGDLYRNFGYIGIVLGCYLLGLLYAWTYRRLDPTSGEPPNVFFYTFVVWMMINGFEGDIPTVYGNLVKSVGVMVALHFVFKLPSARHGLTR